MSRIEKGDILTIEHKNGERLECEVLEAEIKPYAPASQGVIRIQGDLLLSLLRYTTEDGEIVVENGETVFPQVSRYRR